MTRRVLALWGSALVLLGSTGCQAQRPVSGVAVRPAEAVAPVSDAERFEQGAWQFIRAIEHLAQALYRHGLRSEAQRFGIPFLRLPVPTNPNPEPFTYPAARAIMQNLVGELQAAEATLAPIRDEEVKLALRLDTVELDLTGDGKPDGRFRKLLARYLGGASGVIKNKPLFIQFDRGDVAWLRGYCQLLMALGEAYLAYDAQELFDCTAHLFFARAETPHTFLTEPKSKSAAEDNDYEIVDLIAFIHLIDLPVREPARMTAALQHLEQMVALSRESWKFILAETDDDREWLPNPRQKGVLGIPVRQQMVDSWHQFLTEAEQLLAGKKLVPFRRGTDKRGVNLRRVFTEPRQLDLVLWVQGPAATPYLEEGPLTTPEVWERWERVFGGEFMGFALWFN